MTLVESILKDLEALPASKLVEVASFVHNLNPKRREERLATLKATAGCLSEEDAKIFEQAMADSRRFDS